MVVYGYKPDTFIAVYPALQGTDAPRVRVFENTAVYLADWLAENYYHGLKVRLVLQQPQMVQRAELVHLAPPCPVLRVEIIAPLVRMVETHFHVYRIFVFLRVLDNARYHHARKIHSHRLPIRSLLTSVVFMSSKFYGLLTLSFWRAGL